VPIFATFTADDAEPGAGHASAVAAEADEDGAEAAGEDEVVVDAGVEQPASRAMPLTATRAGRSLRGRCTEASWAMCGDCCATTPKFLDSPCDIRADDR
jgi:hypothetical protein